MKTKDLAPFLALYSERHANCFHCEKSKAAIKILDLKTKPKAAFLILIIVFHPSYSSSQTAGGMGFQHSLSLFFFT